MVTLSDALDATSLVHLFCLISIAAIITAELVPASRRRFLSYGARGQQIPSKKDQDCFARMLDWLALIDVPHSWFTHFYVLSLSLSLFWLTQVIFQSRLLKLVNQFVQRQEQSPSAEATGLCMVLMLTQSIRRLVESMSFSRGSTSRMWIGHYIFGMTFYFFVNIAIWIEGVHPILVSKAQTRDWRASLQRPHIVLGLIMFTVSSWGQFLAHSHLASLKKYTLPQHWLFRHAITPHYTAECMIYLSMAVITTPDQYLPNVSLLWITLLTTVNLGITAHGTKRWMMQKFREHESEIQNRYCMFPGIW